MTPEVACPNRDVLQRLLLGRLPPAEAERLAQHLEGCAYCTAVVQTFQEEDTLVEAARSQAAAGDGPEGDPVRRLVERLMQSGPPPAPRTDTPRTLQALPGPAADFARLLAPPQGPGEVGRLGPYRARRVLGAGGMGVVFLAEDVGLKRHVALKVMKPEAAAKPGARERFLREARAAAALEHENVVTIYQVGEEGGVPFIAMQWLKGQSLEERLKGGGPLSVPEVLRLGQQIARGLAVAHAAGLVHRDVKPANLWLEPEGGRLKVLDFGLARAVQDDAQLTQSGAIVGTPAYMAPEQARRAKVGPRSDLFSLGAVLYRMCTGRLPFQGDGAMSMLLAVTHEEPPPVRDLAPAVPPALAELVMRLLAKDPAKRPAAAQEVADRLQAIERHPTAPAAPRPRAPWRGRGGVAAALALAALLPLGYFFGGPVVRFATNKGQLVVQVEGPGIEVAVRQNGVVVQDKTSRREFVLTAGDGEVEVYEQASGLKLATQKFTLTRGGKETVTVRLQRAPAPAAVKAAPDAERRAAEWALSLGGRVVVRVAGEEQQINAVEKLPAAFELLRVILEGNQEAGDAGLAHLKGLPNLAYVTLRGTRVGDAGLAQLQALPNLATLDLTDTRVSDAGLRHLKALPALRDLALANTDVSSDGLAQLDVPSLGILTLSNTRVGDGGLPRLEALPNLVALYLHDTRVSDAGLARLKALRNLQHLTLGGSRVSGAGLVHLKTLPNLRALSLGRTSVGDAGLAQLTALPNLTYLWLDGTRVGDAGLAQLQGAPSLTHLDLRGTRVSDAGLRHLKALPTLQHLNLSDTQVSDGGLASLKDLPNLWGVWLRGTSVSDKALPHLRGLTGLKDLDLAGTKVTAAGVEALRKALPGCRVVVGPAK
jgi:Leucine-rich repeat (LRR) protein